MVGTLLSSFGRKLQRTRNNADVRQDYREIVKVLGRTCTPSVCLPLVAALGIRKDTVVLDVGGGSGGDAEMISSRTGARVFCLDRSIDMIMAGSSRIPSVCGDAMRLPFRDRSADAVYLVNLLQLVPTPDDLFCEIRRVLCKGGRLGLPLTSRDQLRSRFVNLFFPSLLELEKQRYPPLRKWKNKLRNLGFMGLRVKSIDLGCFRVDEDYFRRLESGIFSGLSLLPELERAKGFQRLEAWVRRSSDTGHYTTVRRVRSLVVAEVP